MEFREVAEEQGNDLTKPGEWMLVNGIAKNELPGSLPVIVSGIFYLGETVAVGDW